jgi:hypothetical protein
MQKAAPSPERDLVERTIDAGVEFLLQAWNFSLPSLTPLRDSDCDNEALYAAAVAREIISNGYGLATIPVFTLPIGYLMCTRALYTGSKRKVLGIDQFEEYTPGPLTMREKIRAALNSKEELSPEAQKRHRAVKGSIEAMRPSRSTMRQRLSSS